MDKGKPKQETFTISSDKVVQKVKELINEGNVRRIIVRDKNGKAIVEFPLTIGLVGAVLAPLLAALGAFAALISECTISVERE